MFDDVALGLVDVEGVGEDVDGIEADALRLLDAEAGSLAGLGPRGVDQAESHGCFSVTNSASLPPGIDTGEPIASLAAGMAEQTSVKLVCFDLGGVLVRLARGWDDACRRAGVEVPSPDAAVSSRHHELMLRYETGDVDEAGYLAEAPRVFRGHVGADAIRRVFDCWTLEMYPGAAELLDELKSRGLTTACLSNTNARHWDLLTTAPRYAALQRLDHRLASHELRVMKPNEQAYRRVESATGLWGEQVLFFDDRPENVEGARAVRWKAELIDHVDDTIPQVREYLAAHGVL
jgi:putative hydrolase of the HAD superfamily